MIVKPTDLSSVEGYGIFPALTGEIDGVDVYLHRLEAESGFEREKSEDFYSVFFVISGKAVCDGISLRERDTFLPDYCKTASFFAVTELSLLEIRVRATKEELSGFKKLPILLDYESLPKYTEDCKSEKTISRMIFNDGDIPRLTLGSVEVEGPDAVGAHLHPEVDQFFFSLPENRVYLNIDKDKNEFLGTSIVHIPLGSTHGVEVMEGEKLHYLWCDLLIDEKSSEYIRNAHKFI